MNQAQTTQTVGVVATAVSFVPVVGQIAGPILGAMAPIIGKFLGRKNYGKGEYILAQKYLKYVQGDMNFNDYGKVPDNVVPEAQAFFSAIAGVDIHDRADWENLQDSAQKYLARTDVKHTNVTQAAAELGHTIATHYPAEREGNRTQKWDMTYWYADNFKKQNNFQATPQITTTGAVQTVKPLADTLPEAGVVGKMQNPLTTHWYLWAVPSILIAVVGFFVFRKKGGSKW